MIGRSGHGCQVCEAHADKPDPPCFKHEPSRAHELPSVVMQSFEREVSSLLTIPEGPFRLPIWN